MQIGNHAFGQNAMGISRMGIGQYRNVANQKNEENPMTDVAKMMRKNFDSLELSPQAQKMMADKNESDNVSAQDVAKENSANGVENPEVTSQVPSAKETLASLGYDMEQMNNAVTVKEEVVTERVIDDGVLQALPSAPQKSDFEGTTSTDYYNTIFRTENGESFLPMEEVMEKSIEAYAEINASDASDEYKAQAIAELEKGITNVLKTQSFKMVVFMTDNTSEERREAAATSLEMSDIVNTSKDNLVDSFINHLRATNGNTTTEDAINVMNQEAKLNGDLSFETVFSITDSLQGAGYYVTADELLGVNGRDAMTSALEQIANDIKGSPGRTSSDAAIEELFGFLGRMSEKDVEEEIEDLLYIPSTTEEDEVSTEDVAKSEVMKFVQQAAEQTGNGAIVQQMMMNEEDDELSDQVSDLVFQNNVGTMDS